MAVPTWDAHRALKEQQAEEAGAQLAFVSYPHRFNSTTRMLREVGYE